MSHIKDKNLFEVDAGVLDRRFKNLAVAILDDDCVSSAPSIWVSYVTPGAG